MNPEPSPVGGLLRHPSMIDYPGRLAVVLFVPGCNFRCGFCHNAALLQAGADRLSWAALHERCRRLSDQWDEAAVITGGEPTLDPECGDLVGFLKSFGFFVKLDTNGSRPDVLEPLLPQLDYVAMDVKCAPDRYPEVTGFSDLDAIGRSIGLIRAHARDYEFRTTVVESLHGDDDMKAIGEWIRGARRWVLQPFVPRPDLPGESFRAMPPTAPARLSELRERLAGYSAEIQTREG